ncbi:MAG: FAD-binding oxidoreductase [Actinobacteria bacterium]|nr:FAD-binding oxidoreductase [Actinomycetota bacterium]
MTFERTEVAVIGGGVIGTSIAFRLAQAGKKVVLLEKNDLATGSSGACDKCIFVQSKAPGIHLELALRSAEIYSGLSRELDYDIEYHPKGGMIAIENQEQMEVMEGVIARQREGGLDVRLLTGDEARRREPVLADHVVAAAHSPQDAEVNPFRLAHGFARAARKLGAKILNHTEVKGIGVENGWAKTVITDRGEIRAGVIINAAGVWAPLIGQMVGLEIPIKPRRGQILVTEPVPQMIGSVFLDARYIVVKYNPSLARNADTVEGRLGVALSLGQTDSGNILVGACREFVGYDLGTTHEALTAISRNALRIAAGLRGFRIIRAFAGLRPYTPDGLPILGYVDGVKGFVMAAGHEGDGIALAAITGKLISELVVSGQASVSLEPFRLSRFTISGENAQVGNKVSWGGLIGGI